MVVMRRILALAALAAAMLLLSACERKITYVTEASNEPQSCFACHSDSPADTLHLVAAEAQWQHSKHASGETLNENDSSCKNCHTSEGFVARAATGTPFTANTSGSIENPTAIHCFTCHAPHTNSDFRLRWTATTTLQDGTTYDLKAGNLCAACHQGRRNVKTYISATGRTSITERFGPHHSNQADMLIGSNAYEYAAYTYERSNHRSATEDGCLDCHFKTTLQYVVGGHSFNMEAMVGTEEVRNVAACADCHGEIEDFSEVTLGGVSLQDSVEVRLAELKTILVGAGLVDDITGNPNSASLGADSAGAVFNYMAVKEDRSMGVHNPKYILGLLDSSIKYMTGQLTAPTMTTPLAATGPRRR